VTVYNKEFSLLSNGSIPLLDMKRKLGFAITAFLILVIPLLFFGLFLTVALTISNLINYFSDPHFETIQNSLVFGAIAVLIFGILYRLLRWLKE
jgi:hypothetical protein